MTQKNRKGDCWEFKSKRFLWGHVTLTLTLTLNLNPPPPAAEACTFGARLGNRFYIYFRSAPAYIGSMIMNYSTEPSTPTWISFTFLLANHLLKQFFFLHSNGKYLTNL